MAAVGHRCLASGANLSLTIVAARVLPAADFGELALMMATVALLLIPHVSFISEPMLVYGPTTYRASLRLYVLSLALLQLGFGFLCSIGVAIWGIATGDIQSFGLLALALLLAFCVDFQERSFFMLLRPVVPLTSAAVQLMVLAFLLLFWLPEGSANLLHFLMAYAAALFAANLVLMAAQFMHFPRLGKEAMNFRTMAGRHFAFGTWSATSHLMLFLLTGFYLFMMPLLQDLSTAATFRAQSAVTGAGVQALSAIAMIAVPTLRVSSTLAEFMSKSRQFAALITAAGGAFLLTTGILGPSIMYFVYADKYEMSASGYWLAGAYPLATGYAFLTGSILRALDQAGLLARMTIIAVLASIPFGLLLTWKFGIEGAIIGQIIGTLIISSLSAYQIMRYLNKSFIRGVKS